MNPKAEPDVSNLLFYYRYLFETLSLLKDLYDRHFDSYRDRSVPYAPALEPNVENAEMVAKLLDEEGHLEEGLYDGLHELFTGYPELLAAQENASSYGEPTEEENDEAKEMQESLLNALGGLLALERGYLEDLGLLDW